METVSYGEFSQTFHQRTMRQHLPLSGTIEVTRRCPLTCVHCYNNLPMSDHEARGRELSYQELCRILDEMADAGCLWLLFTGGEIFARRDFLDIYTYAKKKGFLITLFTNGTLITPTDRRPSRRVASVRDRDHAVRTDEGHLRAADGHPWLVRQVPAGHRPPARTRAAARAQDRRGQRQRARTARHAAVRRRTSASNSNSTA